MKKIIFLAISVIMFNGLSQEVKLDSSFGENGVVVIPSETLTVLKDFTTDKNGNAYIVGNKQNESYSYKYDIIIYKLNSYGVLDNQFGENGTKIITLGENHSATDIKLQNDSKILISGEVYGNGRFGFILRLNPDGSLDSSFANNGVYKYDESLSSINAINLLSDNSIIASLDFSNNDVIEAKLLKITNNGELDLQFGTNGIVNIFSQDFIFAFWDSILVNDEIISTGVEISESPDTRSAYFKVDLEGNFITTFGENGKVIKNLRPNNSSYPDNECFCSVEKGTNGKLYLYFRSLDIGIVKINEDGSYDESFASSGTLIPNQFWLSAFAVDSSGSLILASSKKQKILVTAYNSDGSLNTTFNNGENFVVNFQEGKVIVNKAILLDSNSLILAGSYKRENHTYNISMVKLNLGETFSTNDIDKENNLVVYPNPFINQLYITDSENVKNIFLYDISGKEIDIKVNKNKISVNENIAKGVYILKVEFENGTHKTTKLIKE